MGAQQSMMISSNSTRSASPHTKQYQDFIVLFCAVLNSLAGIVVDLYAPSLPAISREFHLSSASVQSTIIWSIIGYALGQLFFGLLSDWKGRRSSILLGLSLFFLASLFAMSAHVLAVLLLARAMQGFAAGSAQVVARAVLLDSLQGERLEYAFVYLSVAFAIGLIAGPYVGGAIQQHYGWRLNFAFYSVYSLILLVIAIIGLRESLPEAARKTPSQSASLFRDIAERPAFVLYAFQLGCCFIGFTLWNQIGPEIVERKLNHPPMYFGLTALAAGSAYLCGSFTNRLLLRRTTSGQRTNVSSIVFAIGVIVLSRAGSSFTLTWIMPGVLLCTFAQGLAFPNILSKALTVFSERAGFAASLQGFGMLVIGSTGLTLVAHVPQNTGLAVAGLYGSLLLITWGATWFGARMFGTVPE